MQVCAIPRPQLPVTRAQRCSQAGKELPREVLEGISTPQGFSFPAGVVVVVGIQRCCISAPLLVLRISRQRATGLGSLLSSDRDVTWLGKREKGTGLSIPSLPERHRELLLRFVKWVISPFYEV